MVQQIIDQVKIQWVKPMGNVKAQRAKGKAKVKSKRQRTREKGLELSRK
jgi:hypothetical protein